MADDDTWDSTWRKKNLHEPKWRVRMILSSGDSHAHRPGFFERMRLRFLRKNVQSSWKRNGGILAASYDSSVMAKMIGNLMMSGLTLMTLTYAIQFTARTLQVSAGLLAGIFIGAPIGIAVTIWVVNKILHHLFARMTRRRLREHPVAFLVSDDSRIKDSFMVLLSDNAYLNKHASNSPFPTWEEKEDAARMAMAKHLGCSASELPARVDHYNLELWRGSVDAIVFTDDNAGHYGKSIIEDAYTMYCDRGLGEQDSDEDASMVVSLAGAGLERVEDSEYTADSEHSADKTRDGTQGDDLAGGGKKDSIIMAMSAILDLKREWAAASVILQESGLVLDEDNELSRGVDDSVRGLEKRYDACREYWDSHDRTPVSELDYMVMANGITRDAVRMRGEIVSLCEHLDGLPGDADSADELTSTIRRMSARADAVIDVASDDLDGHSLGAIAVTEPSAHGDGDEGTRARLSSSMGA